MQITIPNITDNPTNLLRKAGYSFQRHANEQMSFVRPFGRSGFPRFHIYCHLEKKTNNLIINLHLDQKKETYGKDTRHHGEYENSQTVEEEIARIKQITTPKTLPKNVIDFNI